MTKFVKVGGYVLVEVPSWKTSGGLLGFAHLHYFETDVLKLMCIQVGLAVIDVEFTPHLVLICKRSEK